MSNLKTFALSCRRTLFRAQVARFRHCEERPPTRREMRQLWTDTGFRTV